MTTVLAFVTVRPFGCCPTALRGFSRVGKDGDSTAGVSESLDRQAGIVFFFPDSPKLNLYFL